MNIATTIAPATARDIAVIVADAFAHMASRADDLPGWCDQKDSVARALQAALGIKLAPEAIEQEDFLTARAFRDYRRQTRRRYRKVLVKTPRLIAAVDDFEEPDRRFRYQPRLTADDVNAARLVIHQTLLLELARKKRLRATIGDDFLTDWTILKRVLAKHQSFRDIAQELGLDKSGNGIGRRFRAAIATITEALGPVDWPLSPHPRTYNRGPRERTGRRPKWRHQLHIHTDRPGFQVREQVLAPELDLVARFLADGGAVQKLPDGLAVDFDVKSNITDVKRCACYGADGKLLWVISSRPQAAWDNVVLDAERYHDADLDVGPKWQGKAHADFEKKYRRGLQWLDPWQSKPAERFAVMFYNKHEDKLLPGRKNGADRRGRPNRDCAGPDWEYQGIYVAIREPPRQREVYAPGWDDGPIPKRSTVSGVEPGEVRNDTRDLMARWVPPSSYLNLTPEEVNTPFFE